MAVYSKIWAQENGICHLKYLFGVPFESAAQGVRTHPPPPTAMPLVMHNKH